jgi:hypothetical protein
MDDSTLSFGIIVTLIFIGVLLLSPGGIAGIWGSAARRLRAPRPSAAPGAGG